MAEIVVSALLTVVFEKIASALLNKVGGGSKKIHSDLEEWERSLRQIKALLNDASDKEITKEGVKDWLNRLQHLAYDIDDILDALATDHAMHPELTQEPAAAGGITRKVRKLISTCCTASTSSSSNTTDEMHHKLNDITTKLQKLYDEKKDLGLTVIADGRSKDKNRIYQTSVLPPKGIVGREGDKEILVRKLLADDEACDQNFSIVPIVGMGGFGKTTLAKLLYNEPKVEKHFEHKAWVCVSEFDSLNISQAIFQNVAREKKTEIDQKKKTEIDQKKKTEKKETFTDLNLLQQALIDQLRGKRFLLVLDDVWIENRELWDNLVLPFHQVAPGSKIIITTRKENLIQQLRYANPYYLKTLSHEDASSLFAHTVGVNHFDSYPLLRPHGEAIVKKCDGLPLALKALGSLLRTKTNEEDWKEVLESDIWRLPNGDKILPALRLSYLDLSACLKQLFAYTCLFPKDYVFEKEDLIWLWMAEGFLPKGESIGMERLGEIYFDELLSRSFFQYVDNDKSLFVMHDLMNDLATSVAGEFFVRLDIEMKNKIKEHSLKRYRHMSFVREKFMACQKFKEFEGPNSLRTFLAVPVVVRDSNWQQFHLSQKILVDLLPQLPLLRVLCLSKIEIDEVPDSVGDLKHLRYLNLSETQITHLPENVCNLYNLQTLIVFGCDKLSKLPDSFFKLRNLRHFDIRDTPILKNMPLGIGEMNSLQTLSKIVVGGGNEFPISGLKNLKNLRRRVCIHGLDKLQSNDQAKEANLSQMRLSELVVKWSDVFDGSRNQTNEEKVLDVLKPHNDNLRELEIVSYGGTEFPKWVADPLFLWLTVVKMYRCRKCTSLPPLGQLQSLKKLFIRNMDEVKEVGSELLGNGRVAFPSLEVLRFEDMSRWEIWSTNAVGVAVFPCLKELHIERCPNLVEVSLEAIISLRDLRVEYCGDGVLTSLVGVASSVTKLTLWGISGLSDEVWGGVVQSLGAVEELSIWNCNKIRNLWESEEECKVLVNLNKLSIGGCEKLVRIGGGEKEEEGSNVLLLTSLRKLEIEFCKNLERLCCPDSIEELRIYWCRSIKSVSFPTVGGGGGGWQKLKSLAIEGCNSEVLEELEKQVLTINNTNIMPPMLHVVEIWGWENLKSITKSTHLTQLTKLEIRNCPMIMESFPDLQNLKSLKHLKIWNCPRMEGPPPLTSGGGGVSGGVWPPKLESLEIGKLKRPISEWGPLPTSSLVELTVWGGFGSEEEEEGEDVKSFPTSLLIPSSSLTSLWLIDFKKMERISSEGLQHLLTSLQHLEIYSCPKLKDLPETLLPSLLSLTIFNCPNEELKEKMMKSTRGNSYWPLLSHIPKVDISR